MSNVRFVRVLVFFRIALVLPILAPFIVLPFGINAFLAILALSINFAGIQYILFAVTMYCVLGRLRSAGAMHRLMWAAPVLFLPFLIGGWLLRDWQSNDSGSLWSSIGWDLLPLVVYGIVLGYFYVLIVEVAIFLLQKRKWLQES